jgi:hypothetical protein
MTFTQKPEAPQNEAAALQEVLVDRALAVELVAIGPITDGSISVAEEFLAVLEGDELLEVCVDVAHIHTNEVLVVEPGLGSVEMGDAAI